jgi:hypothetical protein
MTHEEVQEYFKTYIEPYKPYEGDPFYDRLVEYLVVYYTEHTYDSIPEPFKVAFETQTTPIEFYEPLLLSNGFTQEVLDKLTFSAKSTLVQSFMDFQRAKGSIRLLKKVVANFNEDYNVYELYIHRTEDDTDWCFIPHPIYLSDEDTLIEEVLDFDETYNKIPRFFVNRDQLDDLYANNDLILPVKTNILFLDYRKIYAESTLTNLYASIVLKEFRLKRLTVYFQDGQYIISFENFWKLWYYIVLRVYGMGITSTPISDLVGFHLDHPGFIYGINDINTLQDEYDNLSLRTDEVTKWYDDRIASIFKLHDTPANYTFEEVEEIYRKEMGDEIIDYVNDRIGVAFQKQNASQVLDELYNSVITWTFLTDDIKVKEYAHYVVDSLPLLAITPENTPTYIMIDFIKPYHVELLAKAAAVLRINDKFNSLYPGDEYSLFVDMVEASIFSLTHHFAGELNLIANSNDKIIASNHREELEILYNNLIFLKDEAKDLYIKMEEATVIEHSHKIENDLKLETNNNNKIVSSFGLDISKLHEDLINIQDRIKQLFISMESASVNEYSHYTSKREIDNMRHTSEFTQSHTFNLITV